MTIKKQKSKFKTGAVILNNRLVLIDIVREETYTLDENDLLEFAEDEMRYIVGKVKDLKVWFSYGTVVLN